MPLARPQLAVLAARWRCFSVDIHPRTGGSMLAWYGLLSSVMEALHHDRRIHFRDPLRRDLDALTEPLRLCRNAVMHVPRSGAYPDPRIEALMVNPDSVRLIHDVHEAFGRLIPRVLPGEPRLIGGAMDALCG